MIIFQSCNCDEPTIENAKYFIDNYGQIAINEFENIDITFEDDYYVIDYCIDRYKIKLENNPKLVQDSVKLRFNDCIRFVYQDNITFDNFCKENNFDDSFYSFNYVNGNDLDNAKKTAYDELTKKINKLNQFGLREITPDLNCKNKISFFLKPRCGDDYHVVVYVKDTTILYPVFWKYFFKSEYANKIKENWYYYTYENYKKYSEIFNENKLQPQTDKNPCFGNKELIDKMINSHNIQHAIIACFGGSCVQRCKNKQK